MKVGVFQRIMKFRVRPNVKRRIATAVAVIGLALAKAGGYSIAADNLESILASGSQP
jgi:hypothetical protein